MPVRPNPKLSPDLEEELHLRLEELLDESDDIRDRKSKINDALKGELKKNALAVAKVRRQLKGQDLQQMEIPGAEGAPEPARDPVVVEILKLAGGIVTKEKPEKEEEPAKASDLLHWKITNKGKTHTAQIDGGEYIVEMGLGGWSASRIEDTPSGAKAHKIAINVGLETAKDLCQKDLLERAGSAILKSTKDPEDEKMARRDLSGEPEKFKKKKGGR